MTASNARSETTTGEYRQHERDSLLLKATLRLTDSHAEYTFRVRNLSAAGLMGEASFEIAPGVQVAVSLRNLGWVPATVAWSLEGRFGLAFHEAIEPHAVRQMPVMVQPMVTEKVDQLVRRPLVAGKSAPRDAEPHRFL